MNFMKKFFLNIGLLVGLSVSFLSSAQELTTQDPTLTGQERAMPRQLVAGRDYYVLAKPIPTASNRLDVIYFFWYGSPWSQSFDPLIRTWADQKAPALVRFQPSPIVLTAGWGYGARVFFALEKMNIEKTVGPALMRALNQGVVKYDDPSSLNKWLVENGVDKQAFSKAINSEIVVAKTASSPSVARMYGIDRVPMVVIDGKYVFMTNSRGDVNELMSRVAFATEGLAQKKAQELRLAPPK